MEFKDILKDLRVSHNLSQQALADAIYVSRSAVAKWENGLGLPNEDSVEQLMKYFNVDRDYLFPVIKQEELIVKNKKMHKFRFGYLIGCIAVVLVVCAVSFIVIKVKGNINSYNLNNIEVISDVYSYDDTNRKLEDNIYYIIHNEKAIICGYDETQGNDIVIKSSYEGYPTTIIGYDAFKGCNKLTSVVLPDTINCIDQYAFSDCSSLTSITISKESKARRSLRPSHLNWFAVVNLECSINEYAFYNCTSLTTITLPEDITTIGQYAFGGCYNLMNITIPESVESIARYAFSGCTNLSSIVIPSGVTFIADGLFENCLGLTSITIPDTVTKIGSYAFSDCTNLLNITIPNTVTSINNSAFKGCSSLTSITIPENVTKIDCYTFLGCTSLSNIVIPNGVTYIGLSAFEGCSSLTSITLPDTNLHLCKYAFKDCTGLISITIPKSMRFLTYYPFVGCTSLSEIVIDKDNTVYDSRDNCNAIIETETNKLIFGCKNTVIPNTVTSIEEYAFYDCVGLTSIVIPNSVTKFSKKAFIGCTGLTSITIPESITKFTSNGFYADAEWGKIEIEPISYSYEYLEYLHFPEEYSGYIPLVVKPITQDETEEYCYFPNLSTITINKTINYIGENAFSNYGSTITINYLGTMDEWNAIEKKDGWDNNLTTYSVECIDGGIEKINSIN